MGKISGNSSYDESDFANPYALYDFTTFTFTNAGLTGANGPTLTQVQTAYSSALWTQNTDYLNMIVQGLQEWTVPANGTYKIEAAGASGYSYSSNSPSNRAIMSGDFNLNQGDHIIIAIGQNPVTTSPGNGGGGSFVVKKDNSSANYSASTWTPLVIAGGGGAKDDRYPSNFTDADATTAQEGKGTTQYPAATTGYGGNGTTGNGGAGGGYLTNGYAAPNNGGYGFLGGLTYPSTNSLVGGTSGSIEGGFGGGGCTTDDQGAAGGGYTGGAGTSEDANGAGGSSYNIGANQINTANTTGSGYVTITKL